VSLILVNSLSIRAVDYDGNHLFVQFHTSDTIYTHYGVPEGVFHSLMNASSIGFYYNRYIRGKYR
jgi:hypothetical protein